MAAIWVLTTLSIISKGLSQDTGPGVIPPKESGNVPPTVHEIVMLEPVPIENVYGRDYLNLECSASGFPAPRIQWSFNGIIFEKNKPFNGQEGLPIRHTLNGNRISIKQVKGRTDGDNNNYDTGRYRCIATNDVGAVFLEKYIHIRVMGKFFPGSTKNDDAKKWNPTVGHHLTIPCPPHKKGYGTEYKWGKLSASNTPEYWRPGLPNPGVFQTTAGELIYAVVTEDDIKESRDINGLRCILLNYGITKASNQQILWSKYQTDTRKRKPQLMAFLLKKMVAAVDTEHSLTCGAMGNPLPKIRWQYQGMDIVSRYNNSAELNFEYFQIQGQGMELRIRRITQYSGGTFRCIASNELGVVWSIGQLSVQFPPKWIKTFPDTIDLAVGNKFSLVCNATGIPRPNFEWFVGTKKLGTTLDERRTVVGDKAGDNGGILTFTSVKFEDTGIYVCVAMNPLNTLTMSVYIRVQEMAPRFDIPLDDPIYLFETATMMIHCKPKGGPVPEKKWQKDGAPIVIEGRYFQYENGSLQITNVQASDAGKYRCIASNTLGKAESEGTAVVLKPTVITNKPESRSYQVGWGYAELFCGASWDPRLDLRIEWYKGGVRMTKFSNRIYLEDRATGPPRLLYLKDLTINDAGNYSCHAYTTVGSVISQEWAYAKLTIKGPPEPPAGLHVASGSCYSYDAVLQWSRGEEIGVSTRRFFIEFTTNNSQSFGKWYGGEGHPHFPGSSIIASPGTQYQKRLTAKELVPGANLIFRIRAASDHMVGRASRPSELGSCITPPDKPRYNPINLTAIVDGPGQLSFTWNSVPDVYHAAQDFRYVVNYRVVGVATFTQKEITDLNITKFEIPSPGIYEQYEFYVRSKNRLGDGPEVRAPYFKAYSGREPPKHVPGGVTVSRISRYSVEISWNYGFDDVDGFRIRYWNTTDAESLRGRQGRARRSVVPIVYKYQYFWGEDYRTGASLTNLTAQVEFLASVSAINTGGYGPESSLVEFLTQARVPGAPSNVNLQIYGEAVHINWSPPIEPNGYIETYEVSYYESGHDNNPTAGSNIKRKTTDRRAREMYMINIFKPMVYYNIKLSARNRVGPGADWEQILVAVSAPDIPGKGAAPLAKPFDDSAVNITYQRPTYGGLPSKFYVYYRPKGDFFHPAKRVEQKFPKRAWILVKGLEFVVYDFWTVGVNSLGQSETSDITEQRPIRKPKPQAHASEFEWWRSNWFIAISMCVIFLLITVIVVVILLKSGPKTYRRLKDDGYNNGYSGSYNGKAQKLEPLPKSSMNVDGDTTVVVGAAAVAGAAAASDYGRNFSSSDAPSDHDAPPPRYSSHSSIEKKELTNSESGSQTGSGSDYSGSETGSDYSDEEDRSYYSDEEKKKDSHSESEPEDDADASTFV